VTRYSSRLVSADDGGDVWMRRRRRKKRCIRFLDTPSDGCVSPLRASAAALADSTSDAVSGIPQPNDVTMTSQGDHRVFPAPGSTKQQPTAGCSPSTPHRKAATSCDSSAPNTINNNQPNWTSRTPGISRLTSPTAAAAR